MVDTFRSHENGKHFPITPPTGASKGTLGDARSENDARERAVSAAHAEPIGELSGKDRLIAEKRVGAQMTKDMDVMTGRHLYEFDNDEEWYVFDSAEAAEREALAAVRQDLEDEPEIFEQSWLQSHIYIGDTDKRLIAGDEADSRLDGVERDDLETLAGEYNVKYSDKVDTSDLEDRVRTAMIDDIKGKLDDPIEYFVNELGAYSVEDLMQQSFINIDVDKAAQDAVDTDGIAHFLARYDGDEVTVRDNGGSLFMYRAN